MNSITITGHLGRDIELRSLSDSTPVGGFSVADSQGRDKPAIWWRCSIFGKTRRKYCSVSQKGPARITIVGSVSSANTPTRTAKTHQY